ncbi:hypothetical protein CEXT_196751 [Caerostris extrusa]|uniref:Uncharacterized protein n=1 Tax=Caerostris extrusa TaxID=172846 RepID=A0AAV4MWW6_CAEEX|nr:hypothetical protein CEXT_196751 [Caerostris extrusa]
MEKRLPGRKVGLLPVGPREVFYFPPTTHRSPMEGIPISSTWRRALLGLQAPPKVQLTFTPEIMFPYLINNAFIRTLTLVH